MYVLCRPVVQLSLKQRLPLPEVDVPSHGHLLDHLVEPLNEHAPGLDGHGSPEPEHVEPGQVQLGPTKSVSVGGGHSSL